MTVILSSSLDDSCTYSQPRVCLQDIKAALNIEEDTLEQIQRIARRQLQRLDVEEEVLQRMLEQLSATQEQPPSIAKPSLNRQEGKKKQQRASTTRSKKTAAKTAREKKQPKRMRKK